MEPTDALKAALDVTLSTEQGDVEIADDLLKTSAFLVALASAGIYFAFSQLNPSAPASKPAPYLAYSYLFAIALLTISILLAAAVHKFYMQFRALARNMLVAQRLLHAELLEKLDQVKQVMAESSVPLWALFASGQISEHIASPAAATFRDTQRRQQEKRVLLDRFLRWQRKSALLGFMLVVFAASIHVVRQIAG